MSFVWSYDVATFVVALLRLTPEAQADTSANMEQWWDWASQPPPSAEWIAAAASRVFTVEPGRTYNIRYRMRGHGVHTYHTKLWWMKNKTENARYFVIGPRHDGNWDWEEVNLTVTVPSAGIHAARLEFWARASGGCCGAIPWPRSATRPRAAARHRGWWTTTL